jgi:hypothetical protein
MPSGAAQLAEFVGEMRLVGVAVFGGGRGPVSLGPSVKVANQPPHPLHRGAALRGETHVSGESPAASPD